MNTLEMIDALTEYFEAAGYSNFYEKKLKFLTVEQIQKLYFETFNEEVK